MDNRIVLKRLFPGGVAPTGMPLVEAVRRQIKRVIEASTRHQYLMEKDTLLVLLEVADHDALAGPLLAREVQVVFDEEAFRFRQG